MWLEGKADEGVGLGSRRGWEGNVFLFQPRCVPRLWLRVRAAGSPSTQDPLRGSYQKVHVAFSLPAMCVLGRGTETLHSNFCILPHHPSQLELDGNSRSCFHCFQFASLLTVQSFDHPWVGHLILQVCKVCGLLRK